MTLEQELVEIAFHQDILEQFITDMEAGGPGSGCHGDNCGRPPGPGHDEPQGEPGEKKADTTGTLMKKFGWNKIAEDDFLVKGQPATTYSHPTHGTIHVTKNWYEHYSPAGTKIGEKTDLVKGTPLSDKLKKYLKEKTPRPGSIGKPTGNPPGMGPAGPKPIEKPVPPAAFGPTPINNFDGMYQFYSGGSGLGGAHDKYVFEHKSFGTKYLFKPAMTLNGVVMPMMARADQLAADIGKMVRPDSAVSAKAVKLTVPGKGEVIGSIQNMVPNLKAGDDKDFKHRDPVSLTANEVKALQQEQVTDWLISNHDAHGGQFLRAADGKVYGIDKSQAFKFFPNDKLSTYFQPNTVSHGEEPPIYNGLFQAVKDGMQKFDPNNTLPAIKNAEAIPDKLYRDILLPYALERYKDPFEAQKFIDQAIARKNNIRKDFEDFYSNVLGKPFKFADDDAGLKPVAPAPKPAPAPTPAGVPSVMKWKPADMKKSLNTPITHPEGIEQNIVDAAQLVNQYKGQKEGDAYWGHHTLDEYNSNMLYKWRQAIMDGESPVEAAKGKGAYAELAAKMGVQPKELETMRSHLSEWVGDSNYGQAKEVQASLQEILNGTCCKTGVQRAYMVEYAITQAKLREAHPTGSITLYRGVGAEHAETIAENAKKYDFVNIKTRGAESYSTSYKIAKQFAVGFATGLVITEPALPIEHVLTSHITHKDVFSGMNEEEYITGFKNQQQKVLAKNTKLIKKDGQYMNEDDNPYYKKYYSSAADDTPPPEEDEVELTGSPEIDMTDDDEQHNWIHELRKKKFKDVEEEKKDQ